jgi:hypothetical protein
MTNEAKSMCFVQQVANRGRLPFAPTARWPLSHLIKLGGNIAQRRAGISNGNRRNELNQVILRGATERARQKLGVGPLLADHPMHRIAQAFLHPVMAASYATPYC